MTSPKELMATAIERARELREERGYEKNGKKHLPVKERLDIFREVFGLDYGIDTTVAIHGPCILANAKIASGPMVIASGSSMVYDGQGGIAPAEFAETKAIGRALACLGLHGGEYASADEMVSVPDKPAPVDKMSETKEDKYRDMPPKERQFREAVDEAFPPSVNKYSFFIPMNNSPEELDQVFSEIDRINSRDELSAYFDALEETMQWLRPKDVAEVKASFQTRSKQLMKG